MQQRPSLLGTPVCFNRTIWKIQTAEKNIPMIYLERQEVGLGWIAIFFRDQLPRSQFTSLSAFHTELATQISQQPFHCCWIRTKTSFPRQQFILTQTVAEQPAGKCRQPESAAGMSGFSCELSGWSQVVRLAMGTVSISDRTSQGPSPEMGRGSENISPIALNSQDVCIQSLDPCCLPPFAELTIFSLLLALLFLFLSAFSAVIATILLQRRRFS